MAVEHHIRITGDPSQLFFLVFIPRLMSTTETPWEQQSALDPTPPPRVPAHSSATNKSEERKAGQWNREHSWNE